MAIQTGAKRLFRSADILQKQSQRTRSSATSIGKTLQKQSVFKRKTIAIRKNLYAKRASAIARRNQEDIVEASRSTGSRRTPGQIIRGSNKGFFGRVLEVVSFAMLGWAVQNLPRIVMMANRLGQQLPKLTNILTSFMTNTFSVFQEIGNLSSGLVRSLLAFDFNSMGRQVQTSLANLSIQFGRLEDDLFDGIKIFSDLFKLDENYKPPGGQQPGQQPPTTEPPLSGKRGDYGAPGEGAVRRYASDKGYGSAFTAGLLATINAESRFDPYAIGDGGSSFGLFQFNNDAGRRQPFLNYLSANGIPNPMALFQNRTGPSAKKYKNRVFGLTLEYMLEREQGSQLVRDYRTSNDLRTIMGGFEDVEGYSGNQNNLPRNRRNNPKYNSRLKNAEAYLQQQRTPTPPPPPRTPGPNVPFAVPSLDRSLRYQSGGVLTGTIGRGVPYVEIGDVVGAPRAHGPHQGIDIFAPTGTYIALRLTGKVVYAGWQNPNNHNEGYGLLVDIWVPELGVQLRFGHCSEILCSTGNTIKAGQSFARVGYTGNATPKNDSGAHIHFEYTTKYNDSNYGTMSDPSPYIPFLILSGQRLNAPQVSGPQRNRATPAQISSTGMSQNISGNITPANEGETLYITVPQQAQSPEMISAGGGGGGSIIIGGGDSLNSLIKQRILLELSYT